MASARSKAAEPVLALAPEDWFWALWRGPAPLPRPVSPPFDPAAARARFAKVAPPKPYQTNRSWSKAAIAPGMDRDEAAFWLEAICRRDEAPAERTSSELSLSDRPMHPSDAAEAIARLHRFDRYVPAEVWLPLAALFPVTEVIQAMLASPLTYRHWSYGEHGDPFIVGFRAYVLPYLTREERDALKPTVSRHQANWRYDPHRTPPLWLRLASALGIEEVVRPHVTGVVFEKTGPRIDSSVLELIYGLGSGAEVEREARRLRLHPLDPDHIRAWLAHTEWSALEWVRDGILLQRRKPAVSAAITALGLARGSETAALLIDLVARSKAPEVARAWLDRYPALAPEALVSVAAGRGKTAEAAAAWLRSTVRDGNASVVEAALANGSPAAERVRRSLGVESGEADAPLPDDLRKALQAVPGDAPTWVRGSDLPSIQVGGLPLSNSQGDRVLAALRQSTLEEPSPLIPVLKSHADARSLDDFAWTLCELWQQHGRKVKENWALAATGVLGGDGCAMKLGPLAKKWREQIMHQLAMMAIECLRVNGSDMALWQLREFSQLQKEWTLRETARRHLESIATSRGLSLEELEDRMTPACGLEADGSMTFDFGCRKFSLVLGSGLEPMVRDSSGELRKDLPKPGARDDAEKAQAAIAEWKLAKKQVSELARLQARRLESAMVTGRRWSSADFRALFLEHPLLGLLSRKLIWGTYHPQSGRLMETFRVSEDQTLSTAEDEPFQLSGDVKVGLPHPLYMIAESLADWGELMADYQIVPPFPQIGRPVLRLEPHELPLTEITRFAPVTCMAAALRTGLESRGWHSGGARDAGLIYEHLRTFVTPKGETTACVNHSGIPVTSLRDAQPQQISSCIFFAGRHRSEPWDAPRLVLGEVDTLVISEVLGDLTLLTRHG